mmetsp:Transcript_17971/g.40830  ORF Transcript_17971/g.40830 Transcript_17971/m.40830 type:complete len:384 (+) Transcript_17971:611-1762(+)
MVVGRARGGIGRGLLGPGGSGGGWQIGRHRRSGGTGGRHDLHADVETASTVVALNQASGDGVAAAVALEADQVPAAVDVFVAVSLAETEVVGGVADVLDLGVVGGAGGGSVGRFGRFRGSMGGSLRRLSGGERKVADVHLNVIVSSPLASGHVGVEHGPTEACQVRLAVGVGVAVSLALPQQSIGVDPPISQFGNAGGRRTWHLGRRIGDGRGGGGSVRGRCGGRIRSELVVADVEGSPIVPAQGTSGDFLQVFPLKTLQGALALFVIVAVALAHLELARAIASSRIAKVLQLGLLPRSGTRRRVGARLIRRLLRNGGRGRWRPRGLLGRGIRSVHVVAKVPVTVVLASQRTAGDALRPVVPLKTTQVTLTVVVVVAVALTDS